MRQAPVVILDRVARLMVLVQQPHHLARSESEAFLRGQTAALARDTGAQHATLSSLADASRRWPRDWDWLIELQYADPDAVRRALRNDTCAVVLGDLRLLGMRPAVTVADDVTELAA